MRRLQVHNDEVYNDDSVSITTREPEVDAPAIDTATCPLDRVTVSRV